MILEDEGLFFDNAAFGDASAVVDLGAGSSPGKGEPKGIFVIGNGDSAGVTAITVTDGATTAAADACMVVTCTSAELNAGGIQFYLPSSVARYVKLVLTGASAGYHTAGITMTKAQTNMVG
jgi:hypothetical protein